MVTVINMKYKKLILAITLTVLIPSVIFSAKEILAQNQNCSPIPAIPEGSSLDGEIIMPFEVDEDGVYTLNVRMMAVDHNSDSFYVTIDNTCPAIMGNVSSIPLNSWVYVNYINGDKSELATYNLSKGEHMIKITANEPGVKLDKIVFTNASSNCVPSGKDNNCSDEPSVSPTVTPPKIQNYRVIYDFLQKYFYN